MGWSAGPRSIQVDAAQTAWTSPRWSAAARAVAGSARVSAAMSTMSFMAAQRRRTARVALRADTAQRGQHLLAVGPDRAHRVGLADELQADDRPALDLLDLADALDVLLGIRGDDEALLGELLVAHLLVGAALHVGRVGDLVAVDLAQLRRLPARRAPDRLVLVVGPRERGLEDDLARLAAVLGACRAVGIDDLAGDLGVAHRPQAVAVLAGDPCRLRPEGRDVELGTTRRPGVQLGVLEAEPAAVHRHRLAVPEPRNRLEPLVEALELLLGRGPVEPERHLVDGLARPHPEPDAIRVHRLEGHPRLRDRARVVVVDDRRDAGADRLRRALPDRAEVHPGLRTVAVGEPGRPVIGGAQGVEARALG